MRKKKGVMAGPEYTAACVSCGTLITQAQEITSGGRKYCAACAITAKDEKPALVPPSGLVRIICYLVSFFSPFAGFALGIVFLSQANVQSRDFGKKCVIIMCISLSLLLLFFILAAAMGSLGASDAGGINLGEGYY